MVIKLLNLNVKYILFIIPVLLISYILKAEITLKAKTPEDKDLGCITKKLASEKSKNAGEMIKYEKLKKLQKSFQEKYKENHFSEKDIQSKFDEHNLKIKEKGQRYVKKSSKMWSKINFFFF